jgi:hypothetical protein
LMEILSSRGELKMLSSEISAINSKAGISQTMLYGSLYVFSASRTAGQLDPVYYSGGNSNCGAVRIPTTYTRLYAPSEGWYLANLNLSTTTGTAHAGVLQIHTIRLSSFIAYKTFTLPAASFGFPSQISIAGMCYLYSGDYIYSYWGSSQAISADINFYMYKL